MSLRVLNPNAEVLNKSAALHMNINAAKGLMDVLRTNLGPKGTIKMYMLYYTSLSLSLSFLRFAL
jgi:T-complex protein 1 subunit zeta